MERIDRKIVGWEVVHLVDKEQGEVAPTSVEETKQMWEASAPSKVKTLKRPRRLGNTWRLKPPYLEHALYVHLSSITVEGRKHPFEVFFSSKDVSNRMWTDNLTLAWSHIFRSAIESGTSLAELISNLKDTNCSDGGYRVRLKEDDNKPTFVNSVVAEIGYVIEEFYGECLAWNYSNSSHERPATEEEKQAAHSNTMFEGFVAHQSKQPSFAEYIAEQAGNNKCPSCKQPTLMKQAGCDICPCGYSKC